MDVDSLRCGGAGSPHHHLVDEIKSVAKTADGIAVDDLFRVAQAAINIR